MDNWWIVTTAALLLLTTYLIGRFHGRKPQDIPADLIDLYKQSLQSENINIISLYKGVQDLPAKVLQAVQGSINPQKGRMAELLTYAELRYDYDRIIPLGQPIDFIGIKNSDRIDFIEVKSGQFHLLTEEEKHIKNLIAAGRVNFRLIKVTEDEIQKFATARKDNL